MPKMLRGRRAKRSAGSARVAAPQPRRGGWESKRIKARLTFCCEENSLHTCIELVAPSAQCHYRLISRNLR